MLKKPLIFILAWALPLASQALSQKQGVPANSIYENRTCQQLYQAASILEKNSLNYESDLFNSQNNMIATVVSTIFTPALYFLGYSNVMSFKAGRDAYHSNQQLDKIRMRMAEMRCFQD